MAAVQAVVVVPESDPKDSHRYIKVARTGELESGRARVVYLKGIEIALFNLGGIFYAVDNLCPHEGGPLAAGSIEGEVLTCPWHRWRFHLPTGCSQMNPAVKIQTYPVRIEGDQVLIGVTAE